MISVSAMREKLGEEAKNLSNKDIERLRDIQYQLAEILFDKWLDSKNTNTKDPEITFDPIHSL